MMFKTKLLTTTFGLALLALPALAQTGPATMSPPMAPQSAQSGDAAAMPHHRHHGMRAERRAERRAMREENRQDAAGLIEAASEALRRGRTAEATDLLEQSETRLLTRSIPADRAGQPMRSPALDSLSSARSAIQSRDRAGAETQMQQAIAILRREGSGMGSGADASPMMPMGGRGMSGQGMPSQSMSGQPMPGPNLTDPGISGQGTYGRGMMQDGGTAGRSMSRADGIVRVQSGGTNSPQDMRNRRDGNPMTNQGATNRGAGGVGAAPTPGVTPTPQVSGGGRSSSGGAVTMGTPSSGNASGTTTPPAPSQGSGR